jgi:hypothetical protein
MCKMSADLLFCASAIRILLGPDVLSQLCHDYRLLSPGHLRILLLLCSMSLALALAPCALFCFFPGFCCALMRFVRFLFPIRSPLRPSTPAHSHSHSQSTFLFPFPPRDSHGCELPGMQGVQLDWTGWLVGWLGGFEGVERRGSAFVRFVGSMKLFVLP